MGTKGITVAGSLIVDVYYMTDTYPGIGRLTNIRDIKKGVGGSGNLIQDLAKLDPNLQVKVSALLGNDANGKFAKQALGRFPNIDMSNVIQSEATSMTMVIEPLDSKQRTFFYLPAASDIYEESCIDWQAVDADIFQLEYLLLMKKADAADEKYGTHAARILCEAQKRGMRTSIDVVSEDSERARGIVSAALKHTDFCIINELEAESTTGVRLTGENVDMEENIPEALRILKDLGVSKWAVVHSSGCSYGLDCETGQTVKVESLHLPKGYIKGTTGAGDAYCCGVLYGAYQGQSLQKAMELGTACAACSLSAVGGSDGMRSYREVLDLYKHYKGGQ